jgi:hypothetical protein
MFPLIAIGGAIGAAFSIAQGTSWLADKLGSAKATTPAGGKADARSQVPAMAPQFEAALAAQAAGQVLPTGAATTGLSTSVAMLPTGHGTDYDALARMKAGILAYGRAGEHHGDHPGVGRSAGSGSE